MVCVCLCVCLCVGGVFMGKTNTTYSLVAYSDFWFRLKKVGIGIGIRKIIGITPEHFGMSLCHSMPISILTQYVRAVTYLIIINLLYSHTM